jgi:hypothetical protein
MNIIILSHERSLNKSVGLIDYFKNNSTITLVVEKPIYDRPYVNLVNEIIISTEFLMDDIIAKVKNCDSVISLSENLLPLQSLLESFYNITNINFNTATILSNKQLFDNHCRKINLGTMTPLSITPINESDLNIFQNDPIIVKADIGTGGNIFFPGDNFNDPSFEYKKWANKEQFINSLKDNNIYEDFFNYNKVGIGIDRFNNVPCRFMIQKFHWSSKPSVSPIGYINNGEVKVAFYVKNYKINPDSPIDIDLEKCHINAEFGKISRDRAVMSLNVSDMDPCIHAKILNYLKTLVDSLDIKNMFFAGPDFHIQNETVMGIDFNPRPSHFMNILNTMNSGTIINSLIEGKEVQLKKHALWGCVLLRSGIIKSVGDLNNVRPYFNSENIVLKNDMVISKSQSLQNKEFTLNVNISGDNESDLIDKYHKVCSKIQEKIVLH